MSFTCTEMSKHRSTLLAKLSRLSANFLIYKLCLYLLVSDYPDIEPVFSHEADRNVTNVMKNFLCVEIMDVLATFAEIWIITPPLPVGSLPTHNKYIWYFYGSLTVACCRYCLVLLRRLVGSFLLSIDLFILLAIRRHERKKQSFDQRQRNFSGARGAWCVTCSL